MALIATHCQAERHLESVACFCEVAYADDFVLFGSECILNWVKNGEIETGL